MTLVELVKDALNNSVENGYLAELQGMSRRDLAYDMLISVDTIEAVAMEMVRDLTLFDKTRDELAMDKIEEALKEAGW